MVFLQDQNQEDRERAVTHKGANQHNPLIAESRKNKIGVCLCKEQKCRRIHFSDFFVCPRDIDTAIE